MQSRSWGNLPVLNEWRTRYPERNPLEIHREFWQEESLVCPGEGEYRWNEEWQTMESSLYGHPGQPKQGAKYPTILQSIQSANFGLTFRRERITYFR